MTRAAMLAVVLVALAGSPAAALFHISVIDELATSVGGDPSQQFVEIRMLIVAQSFVSKSVLAAFDAEGAYLGDVLVVPQNVPHSGAGLRWIMATQAFQSAHGFAADYTIPAGIIPVENGMVCWGAPGLLPPDPASWDHRDPSMYVDCVAYGRFCGTSPGGAPVAATPADHSLARTATTRFMNQDFACSTTFSPRNNAGTELALAGAPCTAVGSAVCGQPLAGGPPAKTDCLGTWVVKGATGSKAVVRCTDGNAACDEGSAAGCFLRAQLCFGLTMLGGHGSCTPAPVTAFTLAGGGKDAVARGNAKEVTDALAALGGQVNGGEVTFATPLAPGTCTTPFHLTVPLGGRAGHAGKGTRLLRSTTRAGKTDRDRLKLVCAP